MSPKVHYIEKIKKRKMFIQNFVYKSVHVYKLGYHTYMEYSVLSHKFSGFFTDNT